MDEKIKIPDKWEEKKLKDIGKIVSGGTPLREEQSYWKGGTIAWATPTDITKNNRTTIKETKEKITELGLKSSSANLLPIGSILMTSRATVGEVKISNIEICTNQGFKSIVVNKKYNNWFIYYLMQQKKNEYVSYGTGTTFLEVNKSDTEKFKLIIPKEIKEQEKIASILQNVDKNIEKTEQIIEKQKKIKAGLMDDLLTGKIRIKDGKKYLETNFDVVDGIKKPADWEIKSFKEIAIICYGKDQKEIEVKNGKYQILGTGGEIGRTNTPLYSRPSVLIGRKGTIDKPMYIEKPFWTVDTLFYTNIKNIYNEKWFYYFIKTVNFLKLNEATGVPSLNTKSINKIKIIVPTENERNMIEEILSKQDRVIEKEEEYLEKLKKLKAGLMEDLLTGRKRIKL
ncbi:MAG: restriction endonuclease subunit S [Paraclostridium sp.]